MNEMKNYIRKKCTRCYALSLMFFVLLCLCIVLEQTGILTSVMEDGSPAASMMFAGCIVSLAGAISAKSALKNPKKLKKYEKNFEDERSEYVQAKACKCAFYIFGFLLLFAGTFATYFSVIVSRTLIITVVVWLLLLGTTSIVFNRKY